MKPTRSAVGAPGGGSPPCPPPFRPPGALGVGFPYIAALPAAFYREAPLDFVELTPETLCRERRDARGRARLDLVPDLLERARVACAGLPIAVHGVELSIGSAHGWNSAYVELLDALHAVWPFAWHSEHLGFQTFLDPSRGPVEAGVPLPLPLTREAARLVARRAARLQARYGVPFLLENAAFYFPSLPRDAGIDDEMAFMGRVVEWGNCGQLLDLHNLHCNAVNHGFDALLALERFPLERVGEIHVAGGAWAEGLRMDSHNDRVPEAVWELLDCALERAPHVAGVVFEVLEAGAAQLTPDVLAGELRRTRAAWQRQQRRRALAGAA
jgi:hypothetical protein